MLRIWGRISSINVRKAVLAAQLLDIPFERVDAGATFGIVRTPEYRAKNPNSLVPLLEDDDGYTLWESNAIVRYLCAMYSPGRLYPTELKARFDAERWMDWQQTTINPAGRDAFVQLIRVAADQRDAALVQKSIAATEPLLALLDEHLSRHAFVAGEQLTMADVPIACEMHRWWGLPLQHSARPHLQRWYDTMLQQPAARGVLDLTLT